jgi:hypothetical protein
LQFPCANILAEREGGDEPSRQYESIRASWRVPLFLLSIVFRSCGQVRKRFESGFFAGHAVQ